MIELVDLTLGYDRHPAVHHLSGRFLPGTMTAIVGPNGAGKSTLLKGIVGLIKPLGGQVLLHGIKAQDIAYAPQLMDMDMSFPLSVLDGVCLGHWRKIGVSGAVTKALQDQARDALHQVGLEGFEARSMESLSVGQRQRVLFARVMVADASVILLDEPFAAVDTNTTLDLLRLMKHWQAQGRTLVAVVHDYDQVRAHFSQTMLLAREIMGWGETAKMMVPEHLQAFKTMAEAWEDHAPLCERSGP